MSSRCIVPLVLICAPAWSQAWQSVESHPRPDWSRPWLNLNGPWDFAFDPNDEGLQQRWFEGHTFDNRINVPFPWQSELSGVHNVDYDGVAWYQRGFTIPADAGPRVFLVFGAVDWSATVWINGQEVTSHEGGYIPFEVELTDMVKPGDSVTVTVRAVDRNEPDLPTGKQVHWYTHTGGIWQTVYMESRGSSYLQQAHVYPDIDSERAEFKLHIVAAEAGEYTVKLAATHEEQSASHSTRVSLAVGTNYIMADLPIPNPALWSPDFPALYDVDLTLSKGDDVVDEAHTYFGMRNIARGTYGGSDHEYILLNNKPIYLRGALHQSFNPKGIYTHPDDDFIRNDYEKAKEYGLNCLRIHIKTEEPRALYWADKLGVMLMCDMPNFWEKSDRAYGAWETILRGQVARDFNHPAIFAWVDFNETWGIGDKGYDKAAQDWAHSMWTLTKELDSTRLVEDNSPCLYDHTETDINSWHFYIDNFDRAKDHIAEVVEKTFPGSDFNYADGWVQGTAPLMNSEYGGVSAGSGDRDISWVFLFLTNLLRKQDNINGYIYTELSDIEWEHNGFMNYDRSDKIYNYPADITVADLQSPDYPVLDCAPYQQAKAGSDVSVPILFSHWSERNDLKLRVSVEGKSIDGNSWSEWIPAVERPVEGASYHVTPQDPFAFSVPNASGLMFVVAEILEDGQRIGANYCVVHAVDGAVWDEPNVYAVTFPVQSFSDTKSGASSVTILPHPGKVYGFNDTYFEYQIQMPKDLKADSIEEAHLIAEIGAKADRERLDWPARTKPQDYPQTDGRAWPTDVTVSIAGEPIKTVSIASDFADARGVLSHVAAYQHGSYGKVVNMTVEDDALAALKRTVERNQPVTIRVEVAADAAHKGGLAVYGSEMGQSPADPTLLLTLAPGTSKPKDEAKAVNVIADRLHTLLETGPKGHVWRYVLSDPGPDWAQPDFDMTAWEIGKGGFGTSGTPHARVGTDWKTPDIWLRTKINVLKGFEKGIAWLSLHHDEDMEVYVNGQPLFEEKGYLQDYERVSLTDAQRALFKPGKENTIAMHCHQTRGGQFVDLGLTVLTKE